jgi:hypothetical protein
MRPGEEARTKWNAGGSSIRRVVTAQRDALRRAAAPRTSAVARTLAIVFAALSIGLAAFGAWTVARVPDDADLGARLAQVAGELKGAGAAEAQKTLLDLWNAGGRRPGVALDLALAAYYDRRLGEATLWAERARRLDPRDPMTVALIQTLTQEDAWHGLPDGALAKTTGGELAFAAACAAFLALALWAFHARRCAHRLGGRARSGARPGRTGPDAGCCRGGPGAGRDPRDHAPGGHPGRDRHRRTRSRTRRVARARERGLGARPRGGPGRGVRPRARRAGPLGREFCFDSPAHRCLGCATRRGTAFDDVALVR